MRARASQTLTRVSDGRIGGGGGGPDGSRTLHSTGGALRARAMLEGGGAGDELRRSDRAHLRFFSGGWGRRSVAEAARES